MCSVFSKVRREHILKDKVCIFQVRMEHILTLNVIICLKKQKKMVETSQLRL